MMLANNALTEFRLASRTSGRAADDLTTDLSDTLYASLPQVVSATVALGLSNIFMIAELPGLDSTLIFLAGLFVGLLRLALFPLYRRGRANGGIEGRTSTQKWVLAYGGGSVLFGITAGLSGYWALSHAHEDVQLLALGTVIAYTTAMAVRTAAFAWIAYVTAAEALAGLAVGSIVADASYSLWCLFLLALYFLNMVVTIRQANQTFIRQVQDNHDRMRAARFDELTGVPNRSSLKIKLDDALTRARTEGEQVCVAFIDLDRFKAVNDVFGHETGDKLLVEVAERILGCISPRDVVARLGGDEFALVLPSVEHPQGALALAQLVVQRMAQPFDIEGRFIEIGASVGLTMFPVDGVDGPTLLKNADIALYRAKESGRSRVTVFERGMKEQVEERQIIERDLREALHRNEMFIAYQPLVDTATTRIVGFEALLRWRHATRGHIPPDVFIPIAEETGLILELGHWVLLTAAREVVSWSMPSRLSVNVSPVQFQQPDLAGRVAGILRSTGLAAEMLDLEVTEGLLIENTERAQQQLMKLRALGVHISLDDFGTGYSSLGYLQRFTLDTIKIDRSYVAALPHHEKSAAIIANVVSLGHSLGMKIVAEGVETAAQYLCLLSNGCDLIQGFLFSKAVSAGEAKVMLAVQGEAGSFRHVRSSQIWGTVATLASKDFRDDRIDNVA